MIRVNNYFIYLAVEMECYAGGYPPPRISWRRENNAILPTGGSIYRGNILKIKAIRKEDRGTYYCVAENGVGRGTKRKKHVLFFIVKFLARLLKHYICDNVWYSHPLRLLVLYHNYWFPR